MHTASVCSSNAFPQVTLGACVPRGGGMPPTCIDGHHGRLSVCLSLACVGNFRRPLMHTYAAIWCLLVERF